LLVAAVEDFAASPWANVEWAFEMLMAKKRALPEVEMMEVDLELYLLLSRTAW
jgi:hypothetical protein